MDISEPLLLTGEDKGIKNLLTNNNLMRKDIINLIQKIPAMDEFFKLSNKNKLHSIQWPDGMIEALKSGEATWKNMKMGAWQ